MAGIRLTRMISVDLFSMAIFPNEGIFEHSLKRISNDSDFSNGTHRFNSERLPRAISLYFVDHLACASEGAFEIVPTRKRHLGKMNLKTHLSPKDLGTQIVE